ncbi:FAD binding domain-containing protein [Ktedonospora formicarum]|uniref:FAD-binding PCMH-type domain-containing protein n=1 Tax=Ktedonospora formicarum TaxID=2778364 RepID=A0A8J3HSL5_9CHLR|nr:FAD binding domain-containing protein [Ktedonospora formicarum]GHO43202.1 hypothetical protein KSX_13650 [Ktedonospora formicarum]
MLLKLVEYHWVEHIEDALLLLGRMDIKTVPLAGGTYLLSLKDESIQAVVDLRDLQLAYVTSDTQYLHLGAMTTLQTLVDSPQLKGIGIDVLSQAAQASSSSRLIRNCATLGGTIATGMASQADLLTVLVALDAEIVVRSGSRTQVNLSGGSNERPGLALSGVVFKGRHERRIASANYELERRPNELISEVMLPKPASACGTSFARISRSPTDVALLNATALVEIEAGRYKRVRLAFGGVNMEPVRISAIEQQLEGQPANAPLNVSHLQALVRNGMPLFRPPSDARVSGGYRRVSGVRLACQVLEEAMNVAHWRSSVASGTGRDF